MDFYAGVVTGIGATVICGFAIIAVTILILGRLLVRECREDEIE